MGVMKECAFTIVAKNYIGLALILEKSIHKYAPEKDFYIIVADNKDDITDNLPENILIAKDILDINEEIWNDMSFKYNLTEFCTSIKPFVFLYLIDKLNYNKVVYLDPDILFFGNINKIFEELDNTSVILTPHINSFPQKGETDAPESDWMTCGIFNLGFCAIRNTNYSLKFLDWWKLRLIDYCYNERSKGQFTDQKWIDFLPALLPSSEIKISRELGWNLAPWNFYERRIEKKENKILVKYRNSEDSPEYQLLFVHFSGYDYKKLINGEITQQNIQKLNKYSDLDLIFEIYSKEIRENVNIFNLYINLEYSYNTFTNGEKITNIHRRLYKGLRDKNEMIADPFDHKGSLYQMLQKKGFVEKKVLDNSKTNKSNLPNIKNKLKVINGLSRLLCKVIGINRYLLLIKLMRPYSYIESQIHLLNSKYDNSNI